MIINPKGTASWLVDNTSLTFEQIAGFCELHVMEVYAIANGEITVASTNPIENLQLTQGEITRCEGDENLILKHANALENPANTKTKKVKKYKFMYQRHLLPCAVRFLVEKYPSIPDPEVAKLVGATKENVAKIRSGTHKGIAGIVPKDPVLSGLCTRKELDVILSNHGILES